MSIKEGGENDITRPENESSVNSDPLKGYNWKDGEKILLKDGSSLFLINNGKGNFGFNYINKDGTFEPAFSESSGISDPQGKNSPFVLFRDDIVEAGTEIEQVDPAQEDEVEEQIEAEQVDTAQEDNGGETKKKIKISAIVKKIAQGKNLSDEDLEKIEGSGKNGSITKKDIENYLKNNEEINEEEEVGEWKEFGKDQRLEVFEAGNIFIKTGSEFYIDKIKYKVENIKEREVGNEEVEYDIGCTLSGKDIKEGTYVEMDLGELEDIIKEVFDSLDGDRKRLKKSLFTPPKKEVNNSAENKKTPEVEKNDKAKKEIKINGFVFVAGETTFQTEGELFRVDEIREVGDTRLDWELTVSKIDPITKEVIEQKQKDGRWLNQIIMDFAERSEINLKEEGSKGKTVALATKEKRKLTKTLEKIKDKKDRSSNISNKNTEEVLDFTNLSEKVYGDDPESQIEKRRDDDLTNNFFIGFSENIGKQWNEIENESKTEIEFVQKIAKILSVKIDSIIYDKTGEKNQWKVKVKIGDIEFEHAIRRTRMVGSPYFMDTDQNIVEKLINAKYDAELISLHKAESNKKESNELADFFSKNLSSSFLKPKVVNEKKDKNKTEQKNNPNKTVDKNKDWAPNRATGTNEKALEKEEVANIIKNEKIIDNQQKEEESAGLSLKEIIEREKTRRDQVYSENLKKETKEKRGNGWRRAWAWGLGLLGLGATAYGVKEYSEKNPSDENLENESKYEYRTEKKSEGFYEEKKGSSKKDVEKEDETKSIFDEIIKEQEGKNKKTRIKSQSVTDSTRTKEEVKPIQKIQPKIDSSKVEIKDIKTPEAPKLLTDAISIYHPELTGEEKNIIGNSYSKVLEYISGEEDIESFYKNLSWLNTMGWSIEKTLDISKRVLAGEYGEVGETEKRMAEYFINFAKRQEGKGLPASGMNTEEYIISGLIKDSGIKKE